MALLIYFLELFMLRRYIIRILYMPNIFLRNHFSDALQFLRDLRLQRPVYKKFYRNFEKNQRTAIILVINQNLDSYQNL